MKKILKIFAFTVLYILTMIISVSADDAKVIVTGEYLRLDQPPVIRDERIMIPLRAVGEALFCKVDWQEETQVAILNIGYAEIKVKIGEYQLERNYISDSNITDIFPLDTPAFIENGRTMVPLRAIAEALFLEVSWDEENRTAVIDKIYDNIGIEKDGYIRVDKEDKMGFMDTNGEIIIPIEYENDVSYGYIQGNGNYAIVKKDDKYGAVDMENKPLVDFCYTLENIENLKEKAITALKRKGIIIAN